MIESLFISSRFMKNFIVALALLFICFDAYSQGIVRGKITDENGETVIGAAVVLKLNKSVGVTTDFDGNYSLTIKDSSAQTILITFVGYTPIEELIKFKKGEVVIRNYTLSPKQNEIKQFEVFFYCG